MLEIYSTIPKYSFGKFVVEGSVTTLSNCYFGKEERKENEMNMHKRKKERNEDSRKQEGNKDFFFYIYNLNFKEWVVNVNIFPHWTNIELPNWYKSN